MFKRTDKQTEAIKKIRDHKYTLLEGGSRCFVPSQEVVTKEGIKKIEDIEIGDIVKSYNELTKKVEYKPVTEKHTYLNNPKPTIKITLKAGRTIEGTEDHEIYYNGGWHTLRSVVESLHGMENNSGI